MRTITLAQDNATAHMTLWEGTDGRWILGSEMLKDPRRFTSQTGAEAFAARLLDNALARGWTIESHEGPLPQAAGHSAPPTRCYGSHYRS